MKRATTERNLRWTRSNLTAIRLPPEVLEAPWLSPAPDPPACRSLISHALSPHEAISLIQKILASESEIKAIGDLSGDDAQAFIDVIYEVRLRTRSRRALLTLVLFAPFTPKHSSFTGQALDLPDLLPRSRRKCLSILYRICGHQALLPGSLQIPLCYDRSETAPYHGGYADVWKGEHQGRHVAAKVLKVYKTDDPAKIRRVGSYHPVQACVNQLILTRVEVLQRGGDVEVSSTPKRAAAVGSDIGRGPIRDGIRVDDKWEHQ